MGQPVLLLVVRLITIRTGISPSVVHMARMRCLESIQPALMFNAAMAHCLATVVPVTGPMPIKAAPGIRMLDNQDLPLAVMNINTTALTM